MSFPGPPISIKVYKAEDKIVIFANQTIFRVLLIPKIPNLVFFGFKGPWGALGCSLSCQRVRTTLRAAQTLQASRIFEIPDITDIYLYSRIRGMMYIGKGTGEDFWLTIDQGRGDGSLQFDAHIGFRRNCDPVLS